MAMAAVGRAHEASNCGYGGAKAWKPGRHLQDPDSFFLLFPRLNHTVLWLWRFRFVRPAPCYPKAPLILFFLVVVGAFPSLFLSCTKAKPHESLIAILAFSDTQGTKGSLLWAKKKENLEVGTVGFGYPHVLQASEGFVYIVHTHYTSFWVPHFLPKEGFTMCMEAPKGFRRTGGPL